MHGFSYVYILESLADAGGFYIGLTDELGARLAKHNEGAVARAARLRPGRVKSAIAFRDRSRAVAFEKYLKSASGRAFVKKRL